MNWLRAVIFAIGGGFIAALPGNAQVYGLCGVGETNIKGEASIEGEVNISGIANIESAELAEFSIAGSIDCGGVCGGGGEAEGAGELTALNAEGFNTEASGDFNADGAEFSVETEADFSAKSCGLGEGVVVPETLLWPSQRISEVSGSVVDFHDRFQNLSYDFMGDFNICRGIS